MKKPSVNPELDSLMVDLLKRVKKSMKDNAAEPIPGLLDMIRVIDRCLTWEKIKFQLKEEPFGSGFADEEPAEE